MMLAVLEQRGRITALGKRDIYCATVGGVKLTEPAADLAIALALASAASDTPCRRTWSRSARWASRARSDGSPECSSRLAEAYRLGFTEALVPSDPGRIPAGMKVTEVADMGDALRVLPRRGRADAPRDNNARR